MSIMFRVVLLLLICFSLALATSFARSAPAHAAGVNPTLVNFDAAGNQVTRYDTQGNAVDAHDGMIAQFGSTYYLYGTSYDCGYIWQTNSTFCGFKVYSSPDLVHWSDQGYVVAPYTCADCFRPHVLYDSSTGKYVLWTNDAGAPDQFRVYTSATPTGLFTQQSTPTLAVPCGWDFTLFQDSTTGIAYIVHTNNCQGSYENLVVEQLTADDLTSSGKFADVPITDIEAPAMFERNGTYYIMMSDPECGYCKGTGTGYMTATNPLGPWTGSTTPANPSWQVQNGALHVTGGGTGIANVGSSWTNYTFSVDATPQETATQGTTNYAQAGMLFRTTTGSNGYAFLLSNYAYSSANAGGYVAFLKDGNLVSSAALPFAVVGGQTYHVAITANGSTFTISVNGTQVDTVTDSTYSSGTIGFREFDSAGESAIFDNVNVTATDNTVLFTDNFSTSSLSQWLAPSPPVKSFIVNSNSCGGQPSFVTPLLQADGSTIYLYASDLWDGAHNEGLANYFWAPLGFNSDGSIQNITCSSSVQLNLSVGQTGSQQAIPGLDQSDGVADFRTYCDIAGGTERLQTFTPSASEQLTSVAITTFKAGLPNEDNTPNAALNVDIVSVNAQGQPTGTLSTNSVAASSIGWTARNVIVYPNIAVTAGQQYGIVLHSSTTQGCYGMAYNDGGLYPAGEEFYSTNSGGSFTAESNRALKFFTTLNYAKGATPSASSSFEGSGWSLAHVNDGQRSSTSASMGWSSNNDVASNHTEWVELDLGGAVPLDQVDLYPRSDATNVGRGFPSGFTIEVSTDNVNWTTVVTETNYPIPTTATGQPFTFTTQMARYVLVNGTSLSTITNENNAYRMQFGEIEVY